MAQGPISPRGTSLSQRCCVLRAEWDVPAQGQHLGCLGWVKRLVVFWKDEGFTSGAVGPPKGVRWLTFHPCFFTPAFSVLLSCCGVLSIHFAPPQRQPQLLQWVNNCYRDRLQSFGILLPPEARLLDGDFPNS